MIHYMKNIKFSLAFVLLFAMSISKAFSQVVSAQTFPDGLSIVHKADFADTIKSNTIRVKLNNSKYNHVSSDNGRYVCYVNYRCSVIDATGKVIIPEEYLSIIRNGDVFEVRKNKLCGLIDNNGRMILPCAYDYLHKISDQLYQAKKNQKIGVVDIHGKEIIPCAYEYIHKMSDQLYCVKKNQKFGVVNILGEEIIPCEYAYIGNISSKQTIQIRNESKCFAIMDTQGKTIIPCEYDVIHEDFDIYRVRKDNRWGGIDSTGRMVIPLEYENLGTFKNGVSKAFKNGYIGCIDKNNRVIFDFKYAYINPFKNGVAEACECEDFVQANNRAMVKRYEKKGYVLLKTPTRLMAMCKNPVYSQLKSKDIIE